jgi:hypothetical protein
MKLLDIYKYNQNFLGSTTSSEGKSAGARLKMVLEAQLEAKQNEKLNDSEEEELRHLNNASSDQ